MKIVTTVVAVLVAGFLSSTCPAAPDAAKPQVMIVGAFHFVSKANVHTVPLGDPLSPRRQAEIVELVDRLERFHPTKVILEETTGTSDIENHYQQYLAGKWPLEASENYQIGFRVAQRAGLKRVYLINAHRPFDIEAVWKYASAHGQASIIAAQEQSDRAWLDPATEIAREQSLLELYRFINSEEAIRRSNAAYMYLTRIGDDSNFVGARLVGDWQLRNLEMFAKLTRVIDQPTDRILVLYGQGHSFLLKEFVRESPDLTLVDVEDFLK